MISPVMPTYARTDVVFDRGEGCYLVATDGRRFLDFGAGVAVNSLGHCHPHLVAALQAQAATLWHTSNLYRVAGQEVLAERLIAHTFADTAFFCNSGAEALECSIKMARKYHHAKGDAQRYRVICMEGAFHGRTLATIAAGGNPKHLAGFEPAVEGFDHVPFGNMNRLRDAISEETAAILIEPVQGEGGIRPFDDQFLRDARAAADEFGLLLIYDEVQTGVGRTGKFFAYEHVGAAPDVMAVAKGIGGGFPVGACLATAEAASGLTAGSHGSTFGGNPLAMAAANAVLDIVLGDGFLEQVQRISEALWEGLHDLAGRYPTVIQSVRGKGLMAGIRFKDGTVNGDVVSALFDRGLLTVPAGDNVVRLLPPLIITETEVRAALAILDEAFQALAER